MVGNERLPGSEPAVRRHVGGIEDAPADPAAARCDKIFRVLDQDARSSRWHAVREIGDGHIGDGHMATASMAIGAATCLWVALVQAWLIVVSYANREGLVVRIIPGSRDLLRSHIDYLMMAQFLFVFYVAFRFMALVAPVWLVAVLVFGSFFNPFAFFIRAMRPHYLEKPPGWFKGLLAISCSATTIGYAVVAYDIVIAAVRAA